MLRRYLPEGGPRIIADVGCGTGQLTRQLAIEFPGARIIGMDASSAMIDSARAAAASAGVGPGAGVRYAVAPAEDLSGVLGGEPVEVLTVATAFHWFDREAALREFHRVLVPGGVFMAVSITEPRLGPGFAAWWEKETAGAWAPYRHPKLERYFELVEVLEAPGWFEPLEIIDLDHPATMTLGEFYGWITTTSFGAPASRAEGVDAYRRRVLGEWSGILPRDLDAPLEVGFRLFGRVQRRR